MSTTNAVESGSGTGEERELRRYPFTGPAFRSMAGPDKYGRDLRQHFLVLKTFEDLEELRGVSMDETDLAHFIGEDGPSQACEICKEEFQPYWGAVTSTKFEQGLVESLHKHTGPLTEEQVEDLCLRYEVSSVFGSRRRVVGSRVVLVDDGSVACDGWACDAPWFNRKNPLRTESGQLIYATPNGEGCLGELRMRAGRKSAQLKTLRQLEWMGGRFSRLPQVSELMTELGGRVEELAQDKKASRTACQDEVRYAAAKILDERSQGEGSEASFFYEKVEELPRLAYVRTQPCCTGEYGDILITALAPNSQEARKIAKARRQRGGEEAEDRMWRKATLSRSRPRAGLRGGL